MAARELRRRPRRLGVVGEHRDLVAPARETVGKHMRGTLDAAALLARDRQAVAEHGEAQPGTARHGEAAAHRRAS